MIIDKITNFYKRFEKWISPIGLIYGFIFTTLTLTRVDAWLENFWIVMHLLVAGFGIFAVTYHENKEGIEKEKINFYLTLIIQFAFGGLFSTFFVFYLRSISFSSSWLFILILLALLIGNELWKKHYQRLAFQVSVFFVSVYLFFIFLLPVLWHRLGADLFIYSGLLSLLITFLFTLLLKKYAGEKFKSHHSILRVSILSIFMIMNILYFANIIPPIPLAVKEAGVYHQVVKNNSGDYEVLAEPVIWSDFFNRYPVFHRRAGETVYAFSAIFSPVKFATQIIHQWQYYDEVKKAWVDSSRIVLPITGGRAEGFRTYSAKTAVFTGLWRVRVMIGSGQVLGDIRFEVQAVTTSPNLVSQTF
jgi:hypothetical protein